MSVRVEAVGEATSLFERKHRAGQRLMLGVAGYAVDDDLRRLVRAIRPAGFVLFDRNIAERDQLRDLCRELGSLVRPSHPALLAIDEEGGRVQRLASIGTDWPTAEEIGRAGDVVRFTAPMGRAIGHEMRALGLHVNFAPVADLGGGVLGDRAFGTEAALVSAHVAAFVDGLQETGVIGCVKHYPGHGHADQDSHDALPTCERDQPQLLAEDLAPFAAAVRSGVGGVMAAHVRYPVWDEVLPASLSPTVVPRWLRHHLGFDGVVFSDDLEMKAISGRFPPEAIARNTSLATVDMLLACKTASLAISLFEALVHVQEEDLTVQKRCVDSVKRIDALRERFLLAPPALPPVDEHAHRALSALIRAHAQ